MRGLRERSKAARLLRDLLSFGVDVVAIQETRFVCDVDASVVSNEIVVYSAYGSRRVRGVSLLVKRCLDAKVGIVHLGAEDRFIVADITVNSVAFWFVALFREDRWDCFDFFRQFG